MGLFSSIQRCVTLQHNNGRSAVTCPNGKLTFLTASAHLGETFGRPTPRPYSDPGRYKPNSSQEGSWPQFCTLQLPATGLGALILISLPRQRHDPARQLFARKTEAAVDFREDQNPSIERRRYRTLNVSERFASKKWKMLGSLCKR